MRPQEEARLYVSPVWQAINVLRDNLERLLIEKQQLEDALMAERAKVIELEREVQRLESEVQG